MRSRINKKDEMILVFGGVFILQIFLLLCFANIPTEKFVLPYCIILFYCVFYLIYLKIYRYCTRVVGFFMTLLTCIRYLIIPCFILLDENYLSYTPLDRGANGMYFQEGCLLTLWEAMVVGVFLAYAFPRWYRQERQKIQVTCAGTDVLWIEIGVLCLVILVVPSVLSTYNFVLRLSDAEVHADLANGGGGLYVLGLMCARVLKIVFPIPFVQYFYSRYMKSRKSRYYYGSALVLGVFYALIMEGNSRNSIIIPAVAVFLVLYYLYPAFRKMTVVFCGGGIVCIAGVTLIWKSFLGNVGEASVKPFSYWIAYVEQYFAGIANMGRAVLAKEYYGGINPKMLFSDLFQSTPFVSGMIDSSETSAYYFLKIWDRNDQVIPSTGNGLFYFGYLLAPLVPVFIIILAHFFEKKVQKAVTVPETIIYIYAAVTVAYNIFNAVSSLGMKLSIYILPAVLVVYLNKKFRLRKVA